MTPPCGSEQALSLAWALETVANFSREEAIAATCELFGIELLLWETCVTDRSWFVGDSRWHSRERIEAGWNGRFAQMTHVWLDDDSWHMPLWQLWLLDRKMVYAANLAYLLSMKGRGAVAGLAKFTGRSKTTASKWARWQEQGRKVRLPAATMTPRVLEFFGLMPSCDLFQERLFLGRSAIQDVILRHEGKHFLECLSGEHLRQAVERLREESARQALQYQ